MGEGQPGMREPNSVIRDVVAELAQQNPRLPIFGPSPGISSQSGSSDLGPPQIASCGASEMSRQRPQRAIGSS